MAGGYDERIEAAVARLEYATEEAAGRIERKSRRAEALWEEFLDKMAALSEEAEALRARLEQMNALNSSVIIPNGNYKDLLLEIRDLRKTVEGLSSQKR